LSIASFTSSIACSSSSSSGVRDAGGPEPDSGTSTPPDGGGGGPLDSGMTGGGDGGVGGHADAAMRVPNMDNVRSALGTNVEEVRDYGTEWVFLDGFKRSRAWFDPTGAPLPPSTLDEHGWVKAIPAGQFAQTFLFGARVRNEYPSGQYIVLYDGSGTVRYSGPVTLDAAQSRPGRDVLQIDSSDPQAQGVILKINATDPSSYIRNIRVIMPGGSCANDPTQFCVNESSCLSGAPCIPFEQSYDSQIFHPSFLSRIKKYRVVRFMHWIIYDDLPNPGRQTWAGRAKVDDARWSIDDKGVPVEIMVALANMMSIDPWFNMPHLADDDYVRQFATYVRDNLDPKLKAHVEHSNEVWNGAYAQARYAQQQGLMEYPDLMSNPRIAGARYHSERSVQIFRIWKDVFGGTDRFVRVLGSFYDAPQLGQVIMSWQNAYQEADALAVAPYFGIRPNDLGNFVGSTAAQVDDYMLHTAVPALMASLMANIQNAQMLGLPVIGYEGGQSLNTAGMYNMDAQLNATFDAANRDPAMEAVYDAFLATWKSGGGQLLVHYTHAAPYSVFGRFGSLEYLDQPLDQVPKYRSLQNFITSTPCWWSGCERR
jgi:hypothetical protein